MQLIQALRAIACILVILLHITGTFFETYKFPFLNDIFKFGGSGVDIFFVLSGFIITYSNKRDAGNALEAPMFFIKRLIRIFPIYWIIISIFLLLQVALPFFYRTHFSFSIINLVNTYLLLPNHNMVNGVSWSLTCEMFFYVLFTIALFVSQKKYVVILLFSYLLFLLVNPLPHFPIAIRSNPLFTLMVFPMNIEFLLGIIIVLILKWFPERFCIPFLIFGISLFIFSAILTYNNITIFKSEYNRVLTYGVPSFIIILSVVKYELTTNIKVSKLFLELGNASYSIYLFHLPIVAAYFKILQKTHITNHIVLLLLSFGLLGGVCFGGIVIYKNIESPIIKWILRAYKKRADSSKLTTTII